MPFRLILASTSRYRAELLARLGLPFESRAPGVDEAPLDAEAPPDQALRLAVAKAQAVARSIGDGLVIGSDQVAHCGGKVLGKPGQHEVAVEQLRFMRSRTTHFDTALALVDAASGRIQSQIVRVDVELRDVTDAEIESYLQREKPYDCAGSAKSEGLGIALMERISGDDPTALVGLPLIALVRMLRCEGVPILGAS
jgi:septum formation protein